MKLKNKNGAIILEYVLLLTACLGIAILIKESVDLGTEKDQSGWLIKGWVSLIETIAEDM